MTDPKVLVLTWPFGQLDPAPLRLLEASGAEVVLNPHRPRWPTVEEYVALADGVKAIIAGTEPYPAELLARFETVELIARTGIGVDSIDLVAAKAHGIAVSYTPDGPSDSVAELTIGLAIALARQVALADREIRSGRWTRRTGWLLRERTVGLVGLGRIGSRVARLLKPFGCSVLAYDIDSSLAERAEELGIEWVDRDRLLAEADLVSIHIPLTPATRGSFDADTFAAMRPGALLLNTARGPIVDEQALLEALESDHLGGAALDVFEAEPYDGPLKDRDDVLLSAHMGSCTDAGRRAMELGAAEAVAAYLRGEEIPRRLV